VGINDLGQKAEMALFPNPNKGTFTIRGKTGSDLVVLEIANASGQVIYRKEVITANGLVDEQVHPDNIPAKGMYILNIKSAHSNTMFRFIVE
jgi:hypothetical protein